MYIYIYIQSVSDWNGSILYWVEPPAQPGRAFASAFRLGLLPFAGSKSIFGDLRAVSV